MRTVADAMHDPVSIEPGASVQAAAAAMLAADAQAAVVAEDGRTRGLLTAEDVAAALAGGCDPATTAAIDAGKQETPVVHPEDPLVDAHRVMRVAQRRVVPVVGPHGEPVGLLVDPEA